VFSAQRQARQAEQRKTGFGELMGGWGGEEGRGASEMPSGFTSLFQLILSALWFPVNKVSVKCPFPPPKYIYIYTIYIIFCLKHITCSPSPTRTVLTYKYIFINVCSLSVRWKK
jgi:hypothetical protein